MIKSQNEKEKNKLTQKKTYEMKIFLSYKCHYSGISSVCWRLVVCAGPKICFLSYLAVGGWFPSDTVFQCKALGEVIPVLPKITMQGGTSG